MTKSKNSLFSPGFSFYFWDLNFFSRALIYLNLILEFHFLSFKSKNFEIWAELLFKKFKVKSNLPRPGLIKNVENQKIAFFPVAL